MLESSAEAVEVEGEHTTIGVFLAVQISLAVSRNTPKRSQTPATATARAEKKKQKFRKV